jgi:hypothetical protein
MPKGQKFGGRQKGSLNKSNAALKEMILGALGQAGGEDYLFTQSQKNPNAFLQLIGKVLPLTLVGDKDNPVQVNLTSTDQEILNRYIAQKGNK